MGIVTLEEIQERVGQGNASLVVPTALEQEKRVWWVELGYPAFAPGKDGFPRSGEVIKYYRERKMDHEEHPYTQSYLAQILGITEQAVRDLENKDAGMDLDRRRFLSKLFDIPPILLGVTTLEQILKRGEEIRRAKSHTLPLPLYSSFSIYHPSPTKTIAKSQNIRYTYL